MFLPALAYPARPFCLLLQRTLHTSLAADLLLSSNHTILLTEKEGQTGANKGEGG